MPLFASISTSTLSVSLPIRHRLTHSRRFRRAPVSSVSSSTPESSPSQSSSNSESIVSSKNPSKNFVESSRPADSSFNYAIANPNGSPFSRFLGSTESNIERAIFDFRFLALFAVVGSLAGSLLCFLNLQLVGILMLFTKIGVNTHRPLPIGKGCVYIVDAYKVYWTSCLKGIHTGQMVLRLVEAIDVYLAGTVMLIFGMGLYGLFISNVPPNLSPGADRALIGSSLFGMFSLKERPKWMKISSLDELKTKVGHVIVMILLVKMFERSKMVTIATGLDLLSYSVCIFLSSASLYILHQLHKPEW